MGGGRGECSTVKKFLFEQTFEKQFFSNSFALLFNQLFPILFT